MNKLIGCLAVTVLAVLVSAPCASAKKEKNSKDAKISMAKVWFTDGTTYEGPLVKHWSTYTQKFTAPGHNFHILPDPAGRSVKCESSQTDSILIISSIHPDFKDSTMVDGRVPLNGLKRKTNKMLTRVAVGRNVDFCKLPYMGNWMRGRQNVDQLMEYWLVRFHNTGQAEVFFTIPLQHGSNRSSDCYKFFIERVKQSNPELAEAVNAKFNSDKKTRKASAKEVVENPQIFVDFVDAWLTEHPE